MSKDEVDAIAKATAEIVKAVPIYEDAIQPAAKEVGKALKTVGGIINVALMPLAATVYGFEIVKQQLKNKLEARMASVSPEDVIIPPLQVVGPLFDKYKYIHDSEELSDMFINLLANSMDKNNVTRAHPSFVNVIAELSPDEARLVKTISTESVLPKIDIKVKVKNPPEGEDGFIYHRTNFTLLGEKSGLQHPELTPSYLSNLERLRIISYDIGTFQHSYSHKAHYAELESHSYVENFKKECEEKGQKCEIDQGIITITDFGKLFIDAVLH